MFKITFLFIFLISVGFQFVSAQKTPNVKFTISTENTNWKKGTSAIVNASIENLSDSKIELPTRIDFQIDEGAREGGTFYAPFSLMKTYGKNAKICQNNLTDENVKEVGNVLEIYPDKNSISFDGKEKKDFKIDLIGLCWARSNSSFYPSENLFTSISSGRYKLYFVMQFDAGIREYKGVKYRAVETERSNEVQIEIR